MPVRNVGRHGYKSDIKALCWCGRAGCQLTSSDVHAVRGGASASAGERVPQSSV
jgi:hypothetical protein